MDLEAKVFAQADRLALDLGGVQFVHVAAVRARANGRLGTVGDILKAWKEDRQGLAAGLPEAARLAAVELAERIFILGAIAALATAEAAGKVDPGHGAAADEVVSPSVAVAPRRRLGGRSTAGPGREAKVRRPTGSGLTPTAAGRSTPAVMSASERSRVFDAEAPTRPRVKRLSERIWRLSERPDVAKAVTQILRKTGYPLGHVELNGRLPVAMRIKPPRKAYRDLPAALGGSRLIYEKRRWWFAGEERPLRPIPKYKSVGTFLANTRKQSKRLIEGILAHLRQSGRTMSASEMLDYMRRELRLPKVGKFDNAWLGHALRRIAQNEPRLINAGGRFRWKQRVRSGRR
jgi:hypothetical protein